MKLQTTKCNRVQQEFKIGRCSIQIPNPNPTPAQGERDWVLQQFKSGQCSILVATDVAARGLGRERVRDVEAYTHTYAPAGDSAKGRLRSCSQAGDVAVRCCFIHASTHAQSFSPLGLAAAHCRSTGGVTQSEAKLVVKHAGRELGVAAALQQALQQSRVRT